MNQFLEDFPVLNQKIHGRRLIYLDNAATTQMPLQVVRRLQSVYEHDNANVFRAGHTLSRRCTQLMEETRVHAARFLNAESPENIIFTSGATESINMTAFGLQHQICQGDEIIVSALEHHSNFVPWQRLCQERGAVFKVIPLKNGRLDMEAFDSMLTSRVRLVAVTEVSNITGEAVDVCRIISRAHANGSLVFVDGAQGVRHSFEIPGDCDFYCMSAHKMFGPAGVGILYGKSPLLEKLKPMKAGGGMVRNVCIEKTVYGPLPGRLEGGTPNYPGIIAFGAALDYIEALGRTFLRQREQELTKRLLKRLSEIDGVHIAAEGIKHCGIVSFDVADTDAYDLGVLLDYFGIAVRTGSHCARPAMDALGKNNLVRVSLAFYNSVEDVDDFANALNEVITRCRRR